MNGAILTREEVDLEDQETTPEPIGSVQQAEEQRSCVRYSSVSVPVSVENILGHKRRKKKDKSTRKPESEWTFVQKPARKVKGAPEVGRAVYTNRYEVLSDLDPESYTLAAQELEEELQRVEREFAAGSEDDPPTKRHPPLILYTQNLIWKLVVDKVTVILTYNNGRFTFNCLYYDVRTEEHKGFGHT